MLCGTPPLEAKNEDMLEIWKAWPICPPQGYAYEGVMRSCENYMRELFDF